MSSSGANSAAFFRWIKLAQDQQILQIRETFLGGHIGTAETLAAPIGDRVQRCVL
jgi:hypothetical protein